MSALETGHFQSDEIRMSCRKLSRPDLVVGTGGIAVLPDIADIERMRNHSSPNLVTEKTIEQIFVQRQRALREDRIAELLELLHDLVIQSGIMVINPSQHDD